MGKKTSVALRLAVLAAVVGVILWWSVGGRRSQEGERATGSNQRSTAVTPASTPEADVTSPDASDAERAAEDELDKVVEDAGRDAAVRVNVKRQMTRRGRVFLQEDEVFLASPTYDELRDEMLAKARSVLERIDASNTAAVTEAAQAELDEFWKRGGLSAADSYEHGYLAQAIMETALEHDPENFQLLGPYKEAVATTTPNYVNDEKARKDPEVIERLARYKGKLLSIAERQKALVIAGRVPFSPEVMVAMYDWVYLAGCQKRDLEAAVEGFKWLVENADACGCNSLKGMFEVSLKYAVEKGAAIPGNLCVWYGADVRKEAINGRRIPGFKGSPERRAKNVWLWQQKQPGSVSVTVK